MLLLRKRAQGARSSRKIAEMLGVASWRLTEHQQFSDAVGAGVTILWPCVSPLRQASRRERATIAGHKPLIALLVVQLRKEEVFPGVRLGLQAADTVEEIGQLR